LNKNNAATTIHNTCNHVTNSFDYLMSDAGQKLSDKFKLIRFVIRLMLLVLNFRPDSPKTLNHALLKSL